MIDPLSPTLLCLTHQICGQWGATPPPHQACSRQDHTWFLATLLVHSLPLPFLSSLTLVPSLIGSTSPPPQQWPAGRRHGHYTRCLLQCFSFSSPTLDFTALSRPVTNGPMSPLLFDRGHCFQVINPTHHISWCPVVTLLHSDDLTRKLVKCHSHNSFSPSKNTQSLVSNCLWKFSNLQPSP